MVYSASVPACDTVYCREYAHISVSEALYFCDGGIAPALPRWRLASAVNVCAMTIFITILFISGFFAKSPEKNVEQPINVTENEPLDIGEVKIQICKKEVRWHS
jgi:hypothetical protein